MTKAPTDTYLRRIADALDRLAPPKAAPPDFSKARAFRFDVRGSRFDPAPEYRLPLELLMGVDQQKARLVETLRRFAAGLPANHVLLWGVRGAGKSSLLKSAVAAQGEKTSELVMIEMDRDQLDALPDLFEQLRGRKERFVVFCDDLSFEAGAAAAKALKSALEGGVAGPPENTLFAATSNRRHLAPQAHDEAQGLLAAAEDAEESVSVSDRFGLWVGFPPMDQATYLDAVNGYCAYFNLKTEDVERRALQWAQLRGARSGRVAFQFIKELAGELNRTLPV